MKLIGIVAILFIVIGLFVFSCIAVAIDALGGVVFFLTIPISLLLFVFGFRLALGLPKSKALYKPLLIFMLGSQLFYFILFFLGLALSPLRPITDFTMSSISKIFEDFTGLSPYFYAREKKELAKQLNENLAKVTQEIRMEDLAIGKKWDRLCLFGPYTNEKEAGKVIGYTSATMERSRARFSDNFVALVFLDEKGTLEIIDIRRGSLDLISLSKTCLTPSDFPLIVKRDKALQKTVIQKHTH